MDPHPSHKMTEWENTIVQISSTPRFGRIRECIYCGAEQAETVAGKAMHDELKYPCLDAPEGPEEINYNI